DRRSPEIADHTYNAAHLLVLEGLEAVRKRPGMYIGSTDTRGLMHCLWEIIDNGVDEALAGAARTAPVTLHPDGSAQVHDAGRGLRARGPVGPRAAHLLHRSRPRAGHPRPAWRRPRRGEVPP